LEKISDYITLQNWRLENLFRQCLAARIVFEHQAPINIISNGLRLTMNVSTDSSATDLELHESLEDHPNGVSQIDDDTFLWTEVPDPNIEQLQTFARELTRLTEGLGRYHLLVDLTCTGQPNAAMRSFLADFLRQQHKLVHISVVTGSDVLLAIAARFVLSHIGTASISFSKTRDQALGKIENSKRHGKQQTNHP